MIAFSNGSLDSIRRLSEEAPSGQHTGLDENERQTNAAGHTSSCRATVRVGDESYPGDKRIDFTAEAVVIKTKQISEGRLLASIDFKMRERNFKCESSR